MSAEKVNTDKIQIGKLIKEQFDRSELSVEKFANLIPCKRDNIYDIF